jgi:antitoxin HicB
MMQEQFTYPARVQKDRAGFFLVTFPDFPEAATDGKSVEESLHNAADALEEAIAGRINRGEPIPRPGPVKTRQRRIPVPAQVAVKAALYMAVKDAGIKNTELARRLGADEKEVRRLLDPHHRSKLPRLEAALEALGRKLVIGIEAIV